MKKFVITALFAFASTSAIAQSYSIEPNHTYPSFEAPHLGISFWRGKFTKSAGKVSLDKAAKAGDLKIEIDTASVDFGHPKMNEHARSKDFFNAEANPKITYVGKFSKFNGDAPSEVQGELTMNGVTKPVTLAISSFKCIDHPMLKREACGADASATLNRRDFGMTFLAPNDAAGAIKLAIQVEAIKD
jgi:polyisoprenoid-binding protein YceI